MKKIILELYGFLPALNEPMLYNTLQNLGLSLQLRGGSYIALVLKIALENFPQIIYPYIFLSRFEYIRIYLHSIR